MKKTYRIEHWNTQMEMWLLSSESEDELWATTMLEENKKLYPKDTYRLVEVTCVERVIG